MEREYWGSKTTALIICVAAVVIMLYTSKAFRSMYKEDAVYPARGFEKHMLSEWEPLLKGTNADTPVFIQNGQQSGGVVYIEGGIHANEPAGVLAAVLMLECAIVEKGRLIIVPFANMSAFTNNYPQDAAPHFFTIAQPGGGARTFRYGSRTTSHVDQWPDPTIYIHRQSGQELDGASKRNMNRAFPGNRNSGVSQLAAFGITSLLKKENVDLAFDLHEAAPEYPVVNTMVVNDMAMELGVMAAMLLQQEGVPTGVEPSPKNFRGLSHREWGEVVPAINVVLMETCNPSQGRLRGRTDERLVLTGMDKCYATAATLGRLFVPYTDGQPLELRTARHVAGIKASVDAFNMLNSSKTVQISNVPTFEQICEEGLGKWLAAGLTGSISR